MVKNKALRRIEELTRQNIEDALHGKQDPEKAEELNKLLNLWGTMVKKEEKKGGKA